MLNAFRNVPLREEELDTFYYDGTMKVRMGDLHDSPIENIYDACKMPMDNNTYLLLGHRGCGKSTELNVMSRKLKEEGYEIDTIQCALDMDPLKPSYSDLLILMGDALLSMAGRLRCKISNSLASTIREFWAEGETIRVYGDEGTLEAEAGVEANTPAILAKLLKLSWRVKSTLKFNEENKTTFRKRIDQRLTEWTSAMNELADIIAEKCDYKRPILIYEDLDKLDASAAWAIFRDHGKCLSAVNFPIVYTFPIALSYDPAFRSLQSFFGVESFPMIKVRELSGKRCDAGYESIRSIIKKRADLRLFAENSLDLAIGMTGGSLRDLFNVIIEGTTRARRRKSDTVNEEDIQRALQKQESSLTRSIERKHYAFLANIAKGNRELIEDKEMLLEMLQAGTVLEYNGKRWHDVHPLVVRFLKEQGLMKEFVT